MGRGYHGTLGVDLKGATERHTPEAIPTLRGVSQIVADGNTAMAVMADGTVRAWGALPAFLTGGRRVDPGVSQPMRLPGLENVANVTGDPSLGFALTKDGRVIGWGLNARGLLGLGTMTPEPQPPTELPTLKDVVSIAAVGGATVAVTRDGRAWTWGSNGQAGLGNGLHADPSDPAQVTPQPIKGISDAMEVKAGSYGRHIIVCRRNGTLIGWGNSDWGSSAPASPAITSRRRRRSLSRGSRRTGSAATFHSPERKTARRGSGVSRPARRGCSA